MFLSAVGRTGRLQDYEPEILAEDGALARPARGAMTPDDMRRMLKRRLTDAGFGTKTTRVLPGKNEKGHHHRYTQYHAPYSPHSFRVMVVTDLLGQGESTRDVAYMVGHKSERTTARYDRTKQQVKRNLVERIRVKLERDESGPQDTDLQE
jgi:integrase